MVGSVVHAVCGPEVGEHNYSVQPDPNEPTIKSSRSNRRMQAARDRQKVTTDLNVSQWNYQVGDKAMLKALLGKGRNVLATCEVKPIVFVGPY
ncbi:hypothetical protein Tco_0237228 [Tanacetum coccineum]